MTRNEYDRIQERLSNKLHNPPSNLTHQYREGFKQGVLASKITLAKIFHDMEEKHGYWFPNNCTDPAFYVCSKCLGTASKPFSHCPHCGIRNEVKS